MTAEAIPVIVYWIQELFTLAFISAQRPRATPSRVTPIAVGTKIDHAYTMLSVLRAPLLSTTV